MLPTDAAAVALGGASRSVPLVPLVRDDAGGVLVGHGRHTEDLHLAGARSARS